MAREGEAEGGRREVGRVRKGEIVVRESNKDKRERRKRRRKERKERSNKDEKAHKK